MNRHVNHKPQDNHRRPHEEEEREYQCDECQLRNNNNNNKAQQPTQSGLCLKGGGVGQGWEKDVEASTLITTLRCASWRDKVIEGRAANFKYNRRP